MSQKILVIDDEADVVDLLTHDLRKSGFTVVTAQEADSALQQARFECPDLIILEMMFPKMSGLEICKLLKSDVETRDIPIIFLTAKTDEVDKVVALELGADDYVTKPFSSRELILRVHRSLGRRTESDPDAETLVVGDLVLDHARHEVRVKSALVDLTATEFKLLALLVERRGRVQARDRLLNDVWGYESAVDTRTVDTHVRRLREKLGEAALYLETVRGVGYRIAEPEQVPS